ncbi:DNA-cytosine methyltransferase [Helicobacter pylori NQ4053]|uniref:DNA-cytosine methyltransferase n=1 Tax=Helicobacter pylori NQ4053 TaxID=992027 RepID=I9ZGP3_HELPX|nr:DNA-cytosine methyltransferase [Helicobacter pylori NQ4053]
MRNALIKRFKISEKETKKRIITFDIQKTDELINGSWSGETLKIYMSL